MSIQYSGNAQTSTFTPTTKQNIIDSVETALLAAGWSTISGHLTTNLLMQSATTPQGYAINVRLKDNAGTCVTFSLESTDGVLVGGNSTTVGGGFLNPTAAFTYRIVCNKYQAFIFATPNPSAARSFVAFGVPYVNSWLTSAASRVGWMMSNGISDVSTTAAVSLRTLLINSSGGSSQEAMYNATIWAINATSINNNGVVGVGCYTAPMNGTAANGYRWQNNSALLIDALIAWGDTASTAEAKYKGQLWDAVVSTDAYAGDTTATFDSHNWIVVTDNNVSSLRGILLLATS